MSSLINALVGLASPWLYVAIAGLAAGESAALVGLVIPGEAALLVGGFAASQGRVSLPVLVAVATVAAIVGDSIGYELGRHLGPRVQLTRVGRWVGEDRWSRAEKFIERRGGPAVLIGRWVGLLRALVPGVAGTTRMPYGRFLVWNVLGAVLWAPTVITAGYFAGGSFRAVEHWLGRASLVIVVIAAFGIGLWLGARWVIAHRQRALDAASCVRRSSVVRRADLILTPPVIRVINRFRPYWAFLAIAGSAMVVIGTAGWVLAETFDAVVGAEGIARLDHPVAGWFDSHRTGWLTTTMRYVSWVGGGTGAIVLPALIGLLGWWRRSWRPALVMGASLGGAIAMSQAIKHITGRARPVVAGQLLDGSAFPSGHTVVAVAVTGALALLVSRGRPWRQQVTIWAGAVFVGATVGFSRAYLGAHWVTDIIGGWLLGTAWLAAVVATDALLGCAGRVEAARIVRTGRGDPRGRFTSSRVVRSVTGMAVGFGLLVASAVTSMVIGARFAVLPDQAVLGFWLAGSLGAGAVASTIDSSRFARIGTLALPAVGWWWLGAQGVALELELLATLAVGLVMFLAGATAATPRLRGSVAGARVVRRKVRAVGAMVLAMVFVGSVPAGAWFTGVRSTPTKTQVNTGGIDLKVSTHQWLASQGMTILAADGHDAVAAFLATPDPTAPEATDPATGAPLGMPNTFAWRLLKGVNDADGVLYPQVRDHLHNHWTHRGRQYLLGPSAASNAEEAFGKAVGFWKVQDRGAASYWLGAALHLVQDACVPQHGWFGIGVYHQDYERWVRRHQDALAVGSGGIYQSDFRVHGGHGGDDWSSAHPRGWADECAHRAFANLVAASHPYPKVSRPTDKQWATAPHIADAQRLSAGFIVSFFDTVGGP